MPSKLTSMPVSYTHLAGAVGNFIDRLANQYVVDFVYFSLIDFPIFNTADIYVTLSVIVLLILIFLDVYKRQGLGEVENYYREMEKALQVRLAYDKKDYIYFINILYQMGIDANIQIIPLSKDITFQTWEQVVQYGTSCLYERQAEMNSYGPEIENILKKYFLRKRDGSYHRCG